MMKRKKNSQRERDQEPMKKPARDWDPRTREQKSRANSRRTNPNVIGWCKRQGVTDSRTTPTIRRSRQSWHGGNVDIRHGDFTIARTAVSKDPCPVSGEEQETAERIIDDLSSGQTLVVRLQPYDPTMEEQTWPTDEAPRNARRNQIAAPGSVSATSATSEGGTKDADESGRDADVASDDDASMASSGVGTEDGWDVSDLTADGAQRRRA